MDTLNSPIQINPQDSKKLDHIWQFGFNTDHAPLVMRGDLQRHMRTAVEHLGMRYWRCHGTLSDDVGLFSIKNEKEHFTPSGLKHIIDAGLATGVKPFFELSFMPASLARSTDTTLTHYRALTSPPEDFAHWGELIKTTVSWLRDTYGEEEVASWYFEVWNEPDIQFWAGTQEEYFTLYEYAAKAGSGISQFYPRQRRAGGFPLNPHLPE